MEKSLLIFLIVSVIIAILIVIFLTTTKSNTFILPNTSEGCPVCSIEEQIGLVRACKCAYNTTLKTDLYDHAYCCIKKTRCPSGWQTCTGSCPDKLGYCTGECLYDGK